MVVLELETIERFPEDIRTLPEEAHCMTKALTCGFWQMQRALKSDSGNQSADMGTTASLVLWEEGNPTIWTAWAGDSPAYLMMCNRDGASDWALTKLTMVDHHACQDSMPQFEHERIKVVSGSFDPDNG